MNGCMCADKERVFVGTELKFKIDITAEGFSMVDDDFAVAIVRGDKVKVFHKEDLVVDDNDDYYCCFDTEEFGSGLVQAVIVAYIPDDDYDDGFREEVYQLDLIQINNVKVHKTAFGPIGG